MAFNATSDSSRTALRLVQEATVGITPNDPTMYELEITGESLTNARETTVSQSFRSDRQVPGAVATGETNSGDINTELKYGAVTWALLRAVLQADEGDSSNTISNGVTRKSFTIEKEFTDATGDKVQAFRGAEFTTVAIAMATGAIITQTYGVMARSYEDMPESLAGAVTPAPATEFMTATAEGVILRVNGVEYEGGLQNFSFTLDNNAREQRQIASTDLAGIGMGRSNLTGSITAYFNGSNALNDAYKAKQDCEIEIEIPDVDSNKLVYTIHKANLTSRTIVAGGLDQDVVLEMQFQGVKGVAKTISIERIPAA